MIATFRTLLDRVGLLDSAQYLHNTLLRYRDGTTLTAQINGMSAMFCTGSTKEYSFLRYYRLGGLSGEKEVFHRFFEDINSDDTVYDIGANVGIYTCFAQQLLDESKLHAFEPHPQNASRLKDNININEGSNLTEVHQVAISDVSGSIQLSTDSNVIGKGTHNVLGNGESTIDVPTERLDTYVKSKGLSNPDVLKIDVEGAEEDVLAGGINTIRNARIVYIEVHPEHDVSVESIQNTLRRCGFDIEQLTVRTDQPYFRAFRD